MGEPIKTRTAPEYTISLDDAPENRWRPIIRDVVGRHGWDGSYGPLLAYGRQIIPAKYFNATVDAAALLIDTGLLGDYGNELRGIVQEMKSMGHAELSIGEITLIQYVYEVR